MAKITKLNQIITKSHSLTLKDVQRPSVDYTDDNLSLVVAGLKKQPTTIKIITIN